MKHTEANSIPIKAILAHYGHFCKKEYNSYLMFVSPFRNEAKGSFQVKKQPNTWHDYGSGEFGSAIDLVMKMEKCTFQQALSIIETNSYNKSYILPEVQKQTIQPQLEIIKTKELINKALIQYIQSRGISYEIARQYCEEIYFKLTGRDKTYFAIAFKNLSGGYELRNKFFKGCTKDKDITLFNHSSDECSVFEGFFDFLSFCQMYESSFQKTDIIVFNSLSMLHKTMPQLQKYKTIYCYLDNDSGGKKAVSKIKLTGKEVKDLSEILYPLHKDFNEYLMKK